MFSSRLWRYKFEAIKDRERQIEEVKEHCAGGCSS